MFFIIISSLSSKYFDKYATVFIYKIKSCVYIVYYFKMFQPWTNVNVIKSSVPQIKKAQ